MPESTLKFQNVNWHGGKISKKCLTAHICSNQTETGKLQQHLILPAFDKVTISECTTLKPWD